jgi:hypothetical protein
MKKETRQIEVFYRTAHACKQDGWKTSQGWYWWTLPDREPHGPFANEADARADARGDVPTVNLIVHKRIKGFE